MSPAASLPLLPAVLPDPLSLACSHKSSLQCHHTNHFDHVLNMHIPEGRESRGSGNLQHPQCSRLHPEQHLVLRVNPPPPEAELAQLPSWLQQLHMPKDREILSQETHKGRE